MKLENHIQILRWKIPWKMKHLDGKILVFPYYDEAKELARLFLVGKAIPQNCPEDALHIAVAAINGIDIIVTWNFKHINNLFIKK